MTNSPAHLAAATAALATFAEAVATHAERVDAAMCAALEDWKGNAANAFAMHHTASTDAATALTDQLTALRDTLARASDISNN